MNPDATNQGHQSVRGPKFPREHASERRLMKYSTTGGDGFVCEDGDRLLHGDRLLSGGGFDPVCTRYELR
jgi:hypothetical protein